MKALSIHQPWAHAILHLGKDVENREWLTRYRGPVLIHASKSCGVAEWDEAINAIECLDDKNCGYLPLRHHLDFGGIVGVADLVDCVTRHKSRWFFGPYGFVLENARPLRFVPFRGLQKFFDVPDDLVARAFT